MVFIGVVNAFTIDYIYNSTWLQCNLTTQGGDSIPVGGGELIEISNFSSGLTLNSSLVLANLSTEYTSVSGLCPPGNHFYCYSEVSDVDENIVWDMSVDMCATTTTTSTTTTTTSTTSSTSTFPGGGNYTTIIYNTGTMPGMNGGTLPGINGFSFGGGASKIFGIAIQSFILICCFLVVLIVMCSVKPAYFGILLSVLTGDFIIHIMQLMTIPVSLYLLINALAIINFLRGARG